ncbi:xanthine dehydrogenase family protein subunit M [Pseudoflavonifractor gallinarum]|uniref:FAD binding domain-containing protein n=1 Tax=Pseudoflavonifractor gallinarum TaxID=2779352 RepID=UPI0036F2298D
MQKLSYLKPQTLKEALGYLKEYGEKVKPYAGGTDLMVQLREGSSRLKDVEYLMDVQALPELRGIEVREDSIRIGAMTSHTEVNESEVLRKHVPFLSIASSTVGSTQIRNKGTVGGNICNASPAADTLSPFVALNARLVVVSVDGEREVMVKDAMEKAGKLKLAPHEMVTSILIDRIDDYSTAFIKLGRRKALAISRMNAAVALKLENGVITAARIAPGCVFSTPDRVEKAEALIVGKAPSAALFEEAGKAVSEEMIARTGIRWSTEYKKPVIEALIQRALCRAAGLPED